MKPSWHFEQTYFLISRNGIVTSSHRSGPNNGRILFGLLESLKAQGKADAIRWVQREFEVAWKGADLQLRLKAL